MQHIEILQMLLDKGVRPGEILDEMQTPPLSLAVQSGRENMQTARMLLDHGAKVNTTDSRDHTPFFEAVIAEMQKPPRKRISICQTLPL